MSGLKCAGLTMPALPEERARVLAVVRGLKAVGVRVRNWKSFLHGEKTPEQVEHTHTQCKDLIWDQLIVRRACARGCSE